jgi:hypothetical protein
LILPAKLASKGWELINFCACDALCRLKSYAAGLVNSGSTLTVEPLSSPAGGLPLREGQEPGHGIESPVCHSRVGCRVIHILREGEACGGSGRAMPGAILWRRGTRVGLSCHGMRLVSINDTVLQGEVQRTIEVIAMDGQQNN